jgi:6-phosphogluconate dehydrogenase
MSDLADIGVIGLAVMGSNLALNLDDHGYRVAVHNRTTSRIDEFLADEAAGRDIVAARTPGELVAALRPPRTILLMVKAGSAVDAQLDALMSLLDRDDMVIDGGNSLYTDTERRAAAMEVAGLRYMGVGISGGEEGARHGPSLMPGGTREAWGHVAPMLQDIAAKADGEPCAQYLGPGGAGHYVKMVHNGIEYGDMQVISEAYDIMRRGLGMRAAEIGSVFARWDEGVLDSFLVEITARLMNVLDDDGTPLVDKVLDAAAQKGTGMWTVHASVDQAAPATLVAEAVFARIVSAAVDDRHRAAATFQTPVTTLEEDREGVLTDLEDALYASKIVSYAQGFMLFAAADRDFGWGLDAGTIASLWRNGAIIRSRFLADITRAFREQPDLPNLMLASFFAEALRRAEPGWRRTVARAVAVGIPIPAYASALAFFDGYRSEQLPANLIQAQRDAFGAHTYERIDRPRGEAFHTDWLGVGSGPR